VAVVLVTTIAAYIFTCDWQVASGATTATAAVVTAIIVYWYTAETKKLRETAERQVGISQDQLEAAIAPVLLVYTRLPPSMVQIGKLKFIGGDIAFLFNVYNAGQGTAVSAHFTVQSASPIADSQRRTSRYELSPIAPRTAMEIKVPRDPEMWDGLNHSSIESLTIEIELLYESTSGKKYRTFIRGLSRDLNDAEAVEYGPVATDR
jgi:hypothetical protein